MSYATYTRRKEQGLCVACGKPRDCEKVMCADCREKNNKYRKEVREFYSSKHICVTCGQNDAIRGQQKCIDCRDREIENRRKSVRVHSKEFKLREKIRHRQRYELNLSMGICGTCGKNKAIPNRTKCHICAEKDKIREAKRRRAKGILPKNEYMGMGFCHCGEKAYKNYRVCEKHYNQLQRANQIQLANRRNKLESEPINC